MHQTLPCQSRKAFRSQALGAVYRAPLRRLARAVAPCQRGSTTQAAAESSSSRKEADRRKDSTKCVAEARAHTNAKQGADDRWVEVGWHDRAGRPTWFHLLQRWLLLEFLPERPGLEHPFFQRFQPFLNSLTCFCSSLSWAHMGLTGTDQARPSARIAPTDIPFRPQRLRRVYSRILSFPLRCDSPANVGSHRRTGKPTQRNENHSD